MVSIIWEFTDSKTFQLDSNIKNANTNVNEAHYVFEIERVKDGVTKKEHLNIKTMVDGDCNGTVSVEPANIAQGLLSLREYGIIFSDDNSRIKLARCIEQNYQQIAVSIQTQSDNQENNERFIDFLGAIGEYIKAAKEQRKNGLSYVLVADFDAIALDCGYQPFEINGLRSLLKQNGYIHTVGNRNTLIIRFHGKVKRVIGFIDATMVAQNYYSQLGSDAVQGE